MITARLIGTLALIAAATQLAAAPTPPPATGGANNGPAPAPMKLTPAPAPVKRTVEPDAQFAPVKKPALRPQPLFRPAMPRMNPAKPLFGDPLPGLTTAQLELFVDGKVDFEKSEDVEGGLGPIFNESSCVACHSSGATGGASPRNVTRFGRVTSAGFDGLDALGGSLLQDQAILPDAIELVPLEANLVVKRNSTPVFGLGLMEAIPDAAIIANVRKQPVDGVKGKVNMITDVVSGQTRVGRFGWKAQQTSVLAFAADAYANEMGVTNRFFPTENAPNGDAEKLAKSDFVLDPEDAPATGLADFEKVANFMKFLAPPPGVKLTPTAAAGQQLFMAAGCALCHVPSMQTGPSKDPAFDRKEVRLFSDLLLHDMGSLGDGIVQAQAGPREMRTAPLWGLRVSAPYLHDGRATTLDAAIAAHDGEAKVSRDRYLKLTPAQKKQLSEFLLSI
ncbi:hypothetical protein LBMAG55_18840 [Verrucomicrobiota bacterium]|nr:hypothetical protein LBMAG55_18840 [Verrucomicrobiota bacterium]